MKLQIVEVFEVYVKSITDWNLVEFLTRFFFFYFYEKAFHILRFWYFKMNRYRWICVDIDNLLTSCEME